MPGAYRTWLPDLGKIVTSSEIYFEENYYPWRKDQPQAIPTPIAAPLDEPAQQAGVPPAGFASEHAALPAPKPASMGEAWAAATRRGALTARDSKHVLILFSGPYRRPDGLAAYLRQHGLEVTMLDNDTKHGGGE